MLAGTYSAELTYDKNCEILQMYAIQVFHYCLEYSDLKIDFVKYLDRNWSDENHVRSSHS